MLAWTPKAIFKHFLDRFRRRSQLFWRNYNLLSRYLRRVAFSSGRVFRWAGSHSSAPEIDNYGLKLWVINLDRRKDRWKRISSHLRAFGVDYERFSAVSDSNGLVGCALSHSKLLAERSGDSTPFVAVAEDDLKFVAPPARVFQAVNEFLQNPALDVLCFSHITSGSRLSISKTLDIATGIRTTAGYIVKKSALLSVAEVFEYSAEAIEKGGDPRTFALDILWQDLQRRPLVFAVPRVLVAIQSPSFSDIQGDEVDYTAQFAQKPSSRIDDSGFFFETARMSLDTPEAAHCF